MSILARIDVKTKYFRAHADASEENELMWCDDWAIGRFMLQSVGRLRTYLEVVLQGRKD
jgi:hypothetical protein